MKNNSKKNLSIIIRVCILVIYLTTALSTGYVAYAKSYDFWLTYNVTDIGGLALSQPTSTTNPGSTPEPTAEITPSSGPTALPWDGASRVTILLMGLDYRDWRKKQNGPPRTDTMILLTIDPLTNTAGMLNIPRDLWVNIPGFGYSKINVAYRMGEAEQLPGGGPGLAMKTVEGLLGVPIDYYAQVDFGAFEQFIDSLGGIYIDVPQELKVDPIGPRNTVVLKPGKQLLDGPTALAYARARYTEGGDFDRALRQQQMIMAMRDRILSLGVTNLLGKASELYNELSAGIHTNLSLEDAIRLGLLAVQVPEANIKRGAIAPPDQVLLAKSPDGSQDILKPVPDKIRLLRDEIFASFNLASPAAQGTDARANMQAEGARIVVLNGTFSGGLAAATQDYLNSQGANVINTGDGEKLTYTRVIDYTGNPYTLRYLVDLMKITPYSIRSEYNPNSDVDVAVILGDDWAGNNPMP